MYAHGLALGVLRLGALTIVLTLGEVLKSRAYSGARPTLPTSSSVGGLAAVQRLTSRPRRLPGRLTQPGMLRVHDDDKVCVAGPAEQDHRSGQSVAEAPDVEGSASRLCTRPRVVRR